MPVYLKLVLTTLFWGGTFTAGRFLARDTGPFGAAFLRFFLASGFLWLLTLRVERRSPAIPVGQWPMVALLGLTGVFAYNFFFFQGLSSIPASRAALIIALNPAAIALSSAFFLGERLTRTKIAGMMVCLAGAVLVLSRGRLSGLFTGGVGQGELCMVGCVASWTAYSLLGKRAMRHLGPMDAVTGSCLAGTLALLPFALAESLLADLPRLTAGDWGALAYLAVCGTGLGFSWYYQAIRAIGTTRAGVFINLVPVSGVLLGWVLLGETLSPSLILGGAIVVCGLFLTNAPTRTVPVPKP